MRCRVPPEPDVVRLAAVFAALAASLNLHAADTYWNVSSGDWLAPGSWTAGVPTLSDRAFLYNGGMATIGAAGAQAIELRLGTTSGSGTLTIGPAGTLTVNNVIYAGYAGTGQLTLSGGAIEQLNLNAQLYVGYGATGSGQVLQSGGTVGLGLLTVGQNGTGSYALNEGSLTLQSSADGEFQIGRYNGAQGTFTQNGGTVLLANRSLRLGESAGGTGIANLNGGTLLIARGNASIGHGGSGTLNLQGGTLLVTNSYIYVALNATATGQVVQTSGRVATKSHLYLGYRGAGSYRQEGGMLELGGSAFIGYGADGSAARGDFTLGGGTCTVAQADGEFCLAVGAGTRGTLWVTNGLLAITNSMKIGQGGEGLFSITGGTVRLGAHLYSGLLTSSTGTIVQTGGDVIVGKSTFLGQRGAASSYTLGGGTLQLSADSYDYWGGNGTLEGHLQFLQTGGTITKPTFTSGRELHLGANSASSCRYEIRGGCLLLPNSTIRLYGQNSRFRIVGAAPEIQIARFVNTSHAEALTEFVLDKSPGHIAPIQATSGSFYLGGTLGIVPKGGLLLAATNVFTLLDVAGQVANTDYVSKPSAAMWTCAWENDQPPLARDLYRAALATGGESWHQGTIDLDGTNERAFAPSVAGSLQVVNISTNRDFRGLSLLVDVSPGGHSLSELAAHLQASGYASVSEESATPPYDLRIAVVAEDVKPAHAGPSWLIWDLRAFDPAATISGVMVFEDRPSGSLLKIR